MVPRNSIKGSQSGILLGLVTFFFFGGWTGLGINVSSLYCAEKEEKTGSVLRIAERTPPLQRASIQVDGYASLLSDTDDFLSSAIELKMKGLEQLQDCSSHLQVLEEQITLAAAKENIVVIGKNQTGKSTLIACLLDQPMQGETRDDGELILSFSPPLLSTLSRISTPWVDIWSKRGEKRVYWEFSGIVDPEEVGQRNAYHDGWQWIALQKILQTLDVRVMMVAPYTSGRSSHPKLYNMLSLVNEFFSLQDLQTSTCLVVTKGEPDINISIHIQGISRDITANTALISSHGKALLAYWAEQGEARIIGFPSPIKRGLIDGTPVKQQLKQSLEHLHPRILSLNPFIIDASLLLPTSQVRAKNIHQFLKESATGVVNQFCQDLSRFLQDEDTSVLNLTSYWQSFKKGASRESRNRDDLLRFFTFANTTENTPELFLQEWQGAFGKEGERAKNLLKTLEGLRDFQGFVDIDRTALRQRIDGASRSMIKGMGSDFKEEIRQELIDHQYLDALPLISPPSTPTHSSPSITVHVLFDKISLGEAQEDESKQDSSGKDKPNKQTTRSPTSGNTMKLGADNTLKVGTDNDVSILSAKLTVEKPLGDQPCKECCEGLRNLCWDLSACCWGGSERDTNNNKQEDTTLLEIDR